MRFGSLDEVFGGDKNIYEHINESQEDYKKPGKISSILKMLSQYGMSFDDQVYKNIKAIPADKSLQSKDDINIQSLYGGVQKTNYITGKEEDKPFSQKTLMQKRNILRKMAGEPEIEDIIDIMTNESIVYDSDEAYICKPFIDNAVIQDLNENALDEIRTATDTIFYRIYLLEELKTQAWNLYRRYLIDGNLAAEIVYDDEVNPKNIIGIITLDPVTLTKEIKDGVTYWVQFKGVVGRERRLLDSQIIYIKYEDTGIVERQSYLERLIRPFNIYRIIEQAQIVWTVTQSSFKTMFTIPVSGMNRAKGLQTLNAAMNRYKEDISFNNQTGELRVNGKVNMPFNKEFWMPENENGKPEITTLVDNGPQINDSEQLDWFASKLYKMSKIPESRFDKNAGSSWFGTDPSQTLRDEINFGRFVSRIRNTFAEFILKPLRIQLALQIPDIKADKRILDAISLRWNSYNQFQELMEMEIDKSRMDYIQSLKDTFTTRDADGNEVNYFCDKFLIIKYLKMSDADLELNAKYKLEEISEIQRAKDKTEEENDNMFADNEPEPDNNEENNIDSEMDSEMDSDLLGDVQPESSETTEL